MAPLFLTKIVTQDIFGMVSLKMIVLMAIEGRGGAEPQDDCIDSRTNNVNIMIQTSHDVSKHTTEESNMLHLYIVVFVSRERRERTRNVITYYICSLTLMVCTDIIFFFTAVCLQYLL